MLARCSLQMILERELKVERIALFFREGMQMLVQRIIYRILNDQSIPDGASDCPPWLEEACATCDARCQSERLLCFNCICVLYSDINKRVIASLSLIYGEHRRAQEFQKTSLGLEISQSKYFIYPPAAATMNEKHGIQVSPESPEIHSQEPKAL